MYFFKLNFFSIDLRGNNTYGKQKAFKFQVFKDCAFMETALIESYIFKTTSPCDFSLCSSSFFGTGKGLFSLTSINKASQILLEGRINKFLGCSLLCIHKRLHCVSSGKGKTALLLLIKVFPFLMDFSVSEFLKRKCYVIRKLLEFRF